MRDSVDIQRAFFAVPGQFLVLRPDSDFAIVAASAGYLEATYTDESIFGQPLFEAFPGNPQSAGAEGRRNLRASLERVLATRRPDRMAVQRYDLRLPAAAGGGYEERYWLAINAPTLCEDGTVQFIIHRVDDAAAKANRDAIAILESITEGFFTLDRHWRFDYVNREAHRILGREPGDLEGKVLWQVYPGLEGTEFERTYHRTMHQRETGSFTAFYAGHERWYEVTTFPAPEGVSVYFRNVTEQKRVQAERDALMAESERQRRIYETALDSTPDFVYVFDLDHRAIYANAALLKTWGVADVRGKVWTELGYEQWHADLHDRELDQVIASGAPVRGEIPFTGTDGRRIYDYIFAPVLNADGQVVAVAGTTRDITERKADEEAVRDQSRRLEEADRAKDEFLATLSHELRNPLAPLRTGVELLRRFGSADDRSTHVHAMMGRQVAQLIRLVDDLLEVSRISRGVFALRIERVDVGATLRAAAEVSDPAIKAGDHPLTLELPTEPLWLDADPMRLTQMFANLLNNAAAYSDPSGPIVVRVRREDGAAAISVRDHGLGIDPAAMPRLFKMFNRGNRDSTRNQGGLGVGLALSRRIAEMHGGTLEARSDGPGRGSEFTVRLPLAGAAATSAALADAADANLGPLRILVVDDNHDAADSMELVLRSLGAEVRVANDGPAGIEAFASWQPSVVLLDIGMPGMNGYDVARAIRSGFPERTATLVAHTGWGQEEDRLRVREAGFDHHLVKPVELRELQQLLTGLAG